MARSSQHPKRKRRLRGLALLGGLALGAWTFRNRKLAENEQKYNHTPAPPPH